MKEIQLTQGKVALVDDADYGWLMQWKWYAWRGTNSFYAKRIKIVAGTRVSVGMHRLIMDVSDPSIYIDHKDGNGLNNQRANLRIATRSENNRNAPSRGGASKYKGVSLLPSGKWRAHICVDRKSIHIGVYQREEEAAISYNEAAIKYHGEFARMNIVTD